MAQHECPGRTCNFCRATMRRKSGTFELQSKYQLPVNSARAVSDWSILRQLQENLSYSDLDLVQQALFDRATGLYNAETMTRELARESAMAARRHSNVSICMLNISVPRQLQKQLGPSCTDAIMRLAAEILRTTVRGTDVAGRSGGHELAVILPDCDISGATIYAERLRLVLHNEIRSKLGYWSVTMHLAVGSFPGSSKDKDLFKRLRVTVGKYSQLNDEKVLIC